MTREQFEHAVRAAGAVLGVDAVLIIGSQAIHASLRGPLPEEALLEAGVVQPQVLRERLDGVEELAEPVRAAVAARIPD